MYTYTYGGKNGRKHTLQESTDLIAVRTRNSMDLKSAVISEKGRNILRDLDLVLEFPEADVSVFRTRETGKNRLSARNRLASQLREEPELRFAGKVLVDPESQSLVLYTENIFIKFFDEIAAGVCKEVLEQNHLKIKQRPDYARNAYFVSTPENTGLKVFEIANALLEMKEVELCHPELIRKRGLKKINPGQWHLADTEINGVKIKASVKADAAHKLSVGENVVIALIDDGFDIDHPEFNSPGKVIFPKDITSDSNDPRPRNPYNNHGTACAGVALASGLIASGVAPGATLLPVRLSSSLGSIAEANAFKWATDHGADIISCSWGPVDGDWSDPDDPLHTSRVDLPDSTRLAMEYAVSSGRNGKGCIITFAAGNGNEDCGFDGYASFEKVIAVSACNDTNRRSVYSDYGDNVWCAFPSSDFGYRPFGHPAPLTNGIFTTDRLGEAGYDPNGDYTDSFGGTSSSCPGVAGTAALILSVNPDLTWKEVKQTIKVTVTKIDKQGGRYDNDGHSPFYGYGKVDAEAAVRLAIKLKSGVTGIRKKARAAKNLTIK
ncbi:MAG: S8 family serine peptidase [Bacteroidales bacterium]